MSGKEAAVENKGEGRADRKSAADGKEVKEDKEAEVKGLDAEPENDMVDLVSREKAKFAVSRKVAATSALAATMMQGDADETEIPLPGVQAEFLELAIRYMKYLASNPGLKEIARPLNEAAAFKDQVGITEFEAKFVDGINEDQRILFSLILAANYLDIKRLLDLLCAKASSMMHGKEVEEVRKVFGIVSDFTKEEEKQIKEANKWAEDV